MLLGQCGSALDSIPLPVREFVSLPTAQILPCFFIAKTTVRVWKTERVVRIISSVSFLECHYPGWVQISSSSTHCSWDEGKQHLGFAAGFAAPGGAVAEESGVTSFIYTRYPSPRPEDR